MTEYHGSHSQEGAEASAAAWQAGPGSLETLDGDEARRLLEDLRIHQVELEAQNEALRTAYQELEAARERMVSLYEHAPVGYLSLDGRGFIVRANLRAAEMLETDRQTLQGTRLGRFVVETDKQAFYHGWHTLTTGGAEHQWESAFSTATGARVITRIQGAPAHTPEDGAHYRVVLFDITRERLAETDRKVSDDRFRALTEAAPIAIFETDARGRCTYVNDAWYRLTGVGIQEASGFAWMEVVHADDLEHVYQAWKGVMASGGTLRHACRLAHPGHDAVSVVLHGQPLSSPDDTGTTRGFIGALIDVTELQQREKQAARQSAFLTTVIESLRYPFMVVDAKDYSVLLANGEARRNRIGTVCHHVRYDQGQPCRPRGRPCVMEEVRSTGSPTTVFHHIRDAAGESRIYEVQGYPVFDDAGHVAQVIEYAIDVTERQVTQEALRQSEERYDLAVRGANDGIWDWPNIANPAIWLSPRCFELLGHGDEDFAPTLEMLTARMHQEDRPRALDALVRHFRDRVPFDITCRFLDASGEVRWFQLRGQALWDDNGMPRRMAGSVRDTSAQKRAENELLQSEANARALAAENATYLERARRDAREKSLLLDEVNHRVKNNLTAILGVIDLERQQVAEGETTADGALENLQHRIEGMAVLHENLSATHWAPICAEKLIREIVACALGGASCQECVTVHIEAPEESIRLAPKQAGALAVIFNELITNSIKYGFAGRRAGKVDVRLGWHDEANALVWVSYRDDGPGYPAGIIDQQGGNVGLHLVRRNARSPLLGKIRLYNDAGAVSELIFRRAPLD